MIRQNKQNNKKPFWIVRLIISIIVIAALTLAGWLIIKGALSLVNGAVESGEASEPDPMFAQEPDVIERPPELDSEEAQPEHATLDDYVPDEITPVDKTADELAAEAMGRTE